MLSKTRIPRVGFVLATASFSSVLPLVVWQTHPDAFGAAMHARLAAAPLAVVAICLVSHRLLRGASPWEHARAALLAASFLFWAANVLWPDNAHSPLFGDLAIMGFAIDVIWELLRNDAVIARQTRASPSLSPPMGDEG